MKNTIHYVVCVILFFFSQNLFSYLNEMEASTFSSIYRVGKFLAVILLGVICVLPELLESFRSKERKPSLALCILSAAVMILTVCSMWIPLFWKTDMTALSLLLFFSTITFCRALSGKIRSM